MPPLTRVADLVTAASAVRRSLLGRARIRPRDIPRSVVMVGAATLGAAIVGAALAYLLLTITSGAPSTELPVPTAAAGRQFEEQAESNALSRAALSSAEPLWRIRQREAKEALPPSTPSNASVPSNQSTSLYSPLVQSAGSREVGTAGSTPLAGIWQGTAAELSAYIRSGGNPHFTVPVDTLATYYIRYAREVGLRADVLWAQMILETGWGEYGGAVTYAQNNFAGIGATGGGAPGCSFPTAEAGAKAHVAHMVAYVFGREITSWTNSSADPRFDMVSPRGVARVLSDLDGRWAVPGLNYGANIERHVAAINR